MNTGGPRTLVALALQLSALVALCLSLLGYAWLDANRKPRVLVLVDRSESVPRTVSDKAVAEVARATKAAGGGGLQLIEFAGRPAAPSAQGSDDLASLQPSATNIEAALNAALATHAQTPLASVVVVSDGYETVGEAARALRAVREAGLPLQWVAVGRPPPPARLAEVLAPDHARVGQQIQIAVQLAVQSGVQSGVHSAVQSAAQLDTPFRVKATARTSGGELQVASSEVGVNGRATVEFDAGRAGAVLVDVVLEDRATGRTIDGWSDAAVIDVAPRAAMLYVQGSTGPLARSLLRGGWALNVIPAARLDAQAEGLDAYQAIVLDDVAIADASPRFWSALVAAVRSRGLGLMVLGGERSFARGGYRGSALESVLPVLSEPAALDQPAAIVFAVDKSGSMGQGSGGVDRFALAQRAVLETARGLTERDWLGLLVFDVVPRVLIPLAPASAGISALERDWQARPNGGTKLAPALEAAISELERSAAARRMLVLVTDGFVDNAPLDALRSRLEQARIETIALAVGPDADVGALERVVGGPAGLVLRVNQAAELPAIMRSGLERRRARVERGTIAVEQRQALPFVPGTWQDWPAISGHFVTRPRPEAVVAVQSHRGEPLIAFQSAGRGRVVAITCGLGPWTPQWLQWPQWPRLAGGLADWISGTPQSGALAVSDVAGGLLVEADLPIGVVARPAADALSIAVNTPTAQGLLLETDAFAPGRARASLPDAGPGLYTFLVSTSHGTLRQLHLRRDRGENAAWGTSPALEAWRTAGLLSPWTADFLAHDQADDPRRQPADRTLVALAVALFLAGVLVDRTRLDRAAVSQALQRWRTRA